MLIEEATCTSGGASFRREFGFRSSCPWIVQLLGLQTYRCTGPSFLSRDGHQPRVHAVPMNGVPECQQLFRIPCSLLGRYSVYYLTAKGGVFPISFLAGERSPDPSPATGYHSHPRQESSAASKLDVAVWSSEPWIPCPALHR